MEILLNKTLSSLEEVKGEVENINNSLIAVDSLITKIEKSDKASFTENILREILSEKELEFIIEDIETKVVLKANIEKEVLLSFIKGKKEFVSNFTKCIMIKYDNAIELLDKSTTTLYDLAFMNTQFQYMKGDFYSFVCQEDEYCNIVSNYSVYNISKDIGVLIDKLLDNAEEELSKLIIEVKKN